MEQIDYKEKYEQALERAKYYHDRDNIQFLENIFPELKESEDERIRKELIAFLKENHETGRADETWSLSGIESWIAWLEKQGEKGAKGNERGIPNPAWSEEDERNLDWLITVCERIYYKSDPQVSPESALMLREWLKSLKDRVQPRQEWSEEDKELLDYVCSILTDNFNENDKFDLEKPCIGALVDWLKSLRPKSQWKPSDEQLAALLTAIGDEKKTGSEVAKVLRELYYELKKLREE